MKKKRLIITAGAKGGTGKTLTTTLLHGWLSEQSIRVTLFDGDAENSTLSRFAPSSTFIDMHRPAALDEILLPLESDQADVVLLDSRAATSEDSISWLQQLGLRALQEEGCILISKNSDYNFPEFSGIFRSFPEPFRSRWGVCLPSKKTTL